MSGFFCFNSKFFLYIFWMNATLISNFMVYTYYIHWINPYCTVFGSHLLHRMHPYYTVIGSHLLHIINPWLHWFWFNFTLYYLYLASDYTISDYTVFQKYSIQCIPGSCCTTKFISHLFAFCIKTHCPVLITIWVLLNAQKNTDKCFWMNKNLFSQVFFSINAVIERLLW